MRALALFPVVLAALASACSTLLPEHHDEQQPAVLEHYGDPPRVTAPASVLVGDPVTVSVTSYGGGCVRKGYTDVVQGERMTVSVRPYDLYVGDGKVVCTDELALYQHDVTLRFDQPGTATIRIHGTRMPGGEPITLTRTVVVAAER